MHVTLTGFSCFSGQQQLKQHNKVRQFQTRCRGVTVPRGQNGPSAETVAEAFDLNANESQNSQVKRSAVIIASILNILVHLFMAVKKQHFLLSIRASAGELTKPHI